MTDQPKIPLPPEGEGASGKSLLERASGAFGLGGFKPAPVPGNLAPEPSRIARRRQKAGEAAEQAAKAKQEPLVEAFPQPSDSRELALVEPLRFTGAKQAVDRTRLHGLGMIVPNGEVTRLLEEFRIVKRQLLKSAASAVDPSGKGKARRVLVSSPLPNEGKTFCATNLALALAAERDGEVLLVDADFAKPSVLSTLGLTGGKGLMDVLANPAIRIEDCVIGTDVPGLWVLPAGDRTNSDSEFLSAARTSEVLDRLTQNAPNRIVIFDSPPALAASPAAELAKHVGQVVVVVRADSTAQNALEDALQLLSSCADIKLLLNDAHFSPSGRRFGSYYGYGG